MMLQRHGIQRAGVPLQQLGMCSTRPQGELLQGTPYIWCPAQNLCKTLETFTRSGMSLRGVRRWVLARLVILEGDWCVSMTDTAGWLALQNRDCE